MRKSIDSKIASVSFNGDLIVIITDDQKYQWKIKDISPRLFAASETDRNYYRISPSGYGIHWPTIDEDLSLNGLLSIERKDYGA